MPQSYYDVTSYKIANVISVSGRHVIQALQWQKLQYTYSIVTYSKYSYIVIVV